MNQELNKELTILQEELGKIKSVSEILNNSKKSVADMAELSEKALNSFLELLPKLNSLIENEVQELTRVKEGFDDGVSDLKNRLLEEITNHRELVNSLLNTQITANSQSISKLSSEVIIAGSQGIEEMKNFSALHHHETENLQKETIREFQNTSKVHTEQVEKWHKSCINKLEEIINHKELINSSLISHVNITSKSISDLSSELRIAGSQGVEEIKKISALQYYETENLQKEIIREFQYISKVQAEQVEKWQNSYINKIDELNELLSVEIGNKHSLIIKALELNNKNHIDLNIKQENQIHSIKIVVFGILGLAIIILVKLFF